MNDTHDEIIQLEEDIRQAVRSGELSQEEADEVYERELAILERGNQWKNTR